MYMKNFGEFFDNQVEYARTIILSRTDITEGYKEKVAQGSRALIREDERKDASDRYNSDAKSWTVHRFWKRWKQE
ncbi:MAG: hypothetical protein ACLSHW_07635 [Lachnospiraceae bacterium]